MIQSQNVIKSSRPVMSPEVVSHYMQLLIGFARNVFMCFRVVLIPVIVGQAFKMAVFMLQIPISL